MNLTKKCSRKWARNLNEGAINQRQAIAQQRRKKSSQEFEKKLIKKLIENFGEKCKKWRKFDEEQNESGYASRSDTMLNFVFKEEENDEERIK